MISSDRLPPMTVVDLRAEATRACGRSRLRELSAGRGARGGPGLRLVGADGSHCHRRQGSVAPVCTRIRNRDDLGQALVMRETGVFFDEMRDHLNQNRAIAPTRCRPR